MGLDKNDVDSFRPISNLTSLAEVIKRTHGQSSTDGLPRILQAPSQTPVSLL